MAIRATITFVKSYLDVDYINASAMDFTVLEDSEYKFYFDTITLSEAVAVAFARNVNDSFVFSDFTLMDISKSIGDSFGFSDVLTNVIH